MSSRTTLNAYGEAMAASFIAEGYDSQGCTFFISPPCSFCLHPGNPRNLLENDAAWEPPTVEELTEHALGKLVSFVESEAKRHLAEMQAAWSKYEWSET